MAGYGKDDIRRDTTGQGKKRSVKVTGYGKDKVKKVYKKGKLAKRKKGTLLTRAMEKAAELQSIKKGNAQVATEANKAKTEQIKSRKEKRNARKGNYED